MSAVGFHYLDDVQISFVSGPVKSVSQLVVVTLINSISYSTRLQEFRTVEFPRNSQPVSDPRQDVLHPPDYKAFLRLSSICCE